MSASIGVIPEGNVKYFVLNGNSYWEIVACIRDLIWYWNYLLRILKTKGYKKQSTFMIRLTAEEWRNRHQWAIENSKKNRSVKNMFNNVLCIANFNSPNFKILIRAYVIKIGRNWPNKVLNLSEKVDFFEPLWCYTNNCLKGLTYFASNTERLMIYEISFNY